MSSGAPIRRRDIPIAVNSFQRNTLPLVAARSSWLPSGGTGRALMTGGKHDMDFFNHQPEAGNESRIGRSVSLDHAAELLGVSRRTIYNRIRDGRLQTIRTVGGSQRVLLESMIGPRRPAAPVYRRTSLR